MNLFRAQVESLDNTLFLSLNSNYAYYSIAKNACTLLKAILYQLECSKSCSPDYYLNLESIHDFPPKIFVRPSQMNMKHLSNFLTDASGRDLIILRDPRKRLISAIRDKLEVHSHVRESIFYKAGLDYDKDLIITDELLHLLHLRMKDLLLDLHFVPQFTVYSMIERPNPTVLALGTPSFASSLEKFIAEMYGISISIDQFSTTHSWVLDHATESRDSYYECSILDQLIDEFYPMDIDLWNNAINL